MFRVAVAYADKVRQQAAVFGIHGEVPLVLLHDRHEHFGRQRQEAGLEAPAEQRWAFDEMVHLVQQIRFFMPHAAMLLGHFGSRVADQRAARLGIRDHAVGLHDGRIGSGGVDDNRW